MIDQIPGPVLTVGHSHGDAVTFGLEQPHAMGPDIGTPHCSSRPLRRIDLGVTPGCEMPRVGYAALAMTSAGGHNQGEPTLDLHGLSLREALRRTDIFLRAEQTRGTISVRILTGHGTGVLKRAIADLLQGHASVASVTTPLRSDAARLVVLRPPGRRPR